MESPIEFRIRTGAEFIILSLLGKQDLKDLMLVNKFFYSIVQKYCEKTGIDLRNPNCAEIFPEFPVKSILIREMNRTRKNWIIFNSNDMVRRVQLLRITWKKCPYGATKPCAEKIIRFAFRNQESINIIKLYYYDLNTTDHLVQKMALLPSYDNFNNLIPVCNTRVLSVWGSNFAEALENFKNNIIPLILEPDI